VPPKKILSISYDNTLLQTRQLLLETRNYAVTSALGFAKAMEQCSQGKWDLLIMGHSIPDRDKRALLKHFRQNSPAPLLALHRLDEPRLEGADFSITPEHPEELLEMVDEIFAEARDAEATRVNKIASGRL
jgi:DNA-binding response OmpR family regulator